ncbi:MAG: hypothetical protein M1832_003740 [Thelocarpon impressellum]|nr:MAG: hypothetical protein M1832_003740 [Thelocarpon impressellum]
MSPAAHRARPPSINLNGVNGNLGQDTPPIAALFLIYFDVKAGYTLSWRRSLPGVQLEGVVEYKSLPSGLHNVKEDLIYFIHDQYAGISAFVNTPADDEGSRNALMLAVGVLVPLSFGRLGRSWRHAQSLKAFAAKLVHQEGIRDPETRLKDLEQYWEANRSRSDHGASAAESPLESPSSLRFKFVPRFGVKGRQRDRTASDGASLLPPGQALTPHHPALSLPDFLDDFGPLIFPLHRAGLLRKRILLVGQAPVQKACDYVYDISIISNIPLSVNDLISPASPPPRLRPLFTVGANDIPMLEEEAKGPRPGDEDVDDETGQGWVAFTTDGILAIKESLYDVLVTIPPAHARDAAERAWPKIESPRGTEVKATQRDARRYAALRKGLARFGDGESRKSLASSDEIRGDNDDDADEPSDDDDRARLLPREHRYTDGAVDAGDPSGADDARVEPMSWPAVAYTSYLWWASAGERRTDMEEEEEGDDALLDGLDAVVQHTPPSRGSGRWASSDVEVAAARRTTPTAPEMALIAYFHRLTASMLSTVADRVDSADEDEDGTDDDGKGLVLSREDLARLGVDVWSARDRAFVEELVRAYFERTAEVQGERVECCGVRVF